MEKTPKVCVNIIVIKNNKILLGLLTEKWNIEGKRVYGLPGRDILFGEKIGQTVGRNIKEEFGCEVSSYKIFSVNANYEYGNHYIGIGVIAEISGEIKLLMKEDWEKWEWFDKDKIPENLMPGALYDIKCYLQNKFNIVE